MRCRRRLSAVGIVLVTAGSTAFAGVTLPGAAHAAPGIVTTSTDAPAPGAPGAPETLSAGPGSKDGFRLTWPVPAPGDSPILGYQYSSDDGKSWRDLAATGDAPMQADVAADSAGGFPFGPGGVYRFRVRALNSQGAGERSPFADQSLPAGPPGAPGRLGVAPRPQSFALSFDAVPDNGSPLTGWEYTTDNGAQWQPLTGITGDTQLSATLTLQSSGDGTAPLVTGTTYQIRIRARNGAGPGKESVTVAASLVTPGTPAAPGVPFDIHAEPGDRSIALRWGATDNGSSITGWAYTTDDGTTWRQLSPVTYDTTEFATASIQQTSTGGGLQNGQSYRIRLRGTNELGTGPAGDPITVALPTPGSPGRPSQQAGSSAGETIRIDFTAPDPGASAISGYQYSTDDGNTWAGIDAQGTGPRYVTITAPSDGGTALDRDDKYAVRLRAVNAQGPGLPSARIDVRLSPAVPGKPFAVSVLPGSRQATVTLSVRPNGAEITGLEYSTDDGATWREVTEIDEVDERSGRFVVTTVSGGDGTERLADATTYRLRLRVSNELGTGPAGDAVAFTTITAPGAPATLTALPGNASGKLAAAVPDSGGSAITGWEYTTDGGTTWAELTGPAAVITTASGKSRPNLVNDTTYQVRVRARNAIGTGTPSPVAMLTPLAPPAAPTGVTAVAGTSTIAVSWTAPAPGGAAVTGYTAIASPGPAVCETITATTCVLGAEVDKPYTIRVIARSASGDSPASPASAPVSATAPVIPATPPATDAVLNLPVGSGNTTPPGSTITLSGTGYAPDSDVALVVYSALVSLGTVRTDAQGSFSVAVVVPPTLAGDHTIAAMGADPLGNVRAMRLDVTVAAAPTTPAPVPAPSTPAPVPPAAPTGVVAAARTSAISVSWTAPAGNVTGYTAVASPGPAVCETTTATSCVLGAKPGTPYTIRVIAHSANGDSPASPASAPVTAAAPAVPSTAPADGDELTAPGEVAPGATMTVRGSGYAPYSDVELVVYSAPIPLATVRADAAGEFSAEVVVPAGLTGQHTIAALGADPQGDPRTMRLGITVAADTSPVPPVTPAPSRPDPASPTPAPPAPPGLPVTGPATALGMLLMVIGAVLAGLTRSGRPGRARRTAPPR